MPVRTCLLGPVLLAMVFSPGCGSSRMRAQAGALAEVGARLERETAEFAAARSAVVQLRQRNLVERRQQAAEQGQFNARTIHFWKIAGDPERQKRLALYDGLVAASAAAAAVQERPLEWEESVVTRSHALTIDRGALHRFVQQLLTLSRPPRFLDDARFFAEYGAVVGQQVQEGLADVQASVAAAASVSAGAAASLGAAADLAARPVTPPSQPPTPPPDPLADPKPPGDRAPRPSDDPRNPGRAAAPL